MATVCSEFNNRNKKTVNGGTLMKIFIEIIANNPNISGYESIENGEICQNVGGKRTLWKKSTNASMFQFNSFIQSATKNRFLLMFMFNIRLIFAISINANVTDSVLLPENVSCGSVRWKKYVCNVAEARKKCCLPSGLFRIRACFSLFVDALIFRKCTIRLRNMQSEAIGKAVPIRIIKNHFNLLHNSWQRQHVVVRLCEHFHCMVP